MSEHQQWTAAESRAVCHERQGGLCARCWTPLPAVTDGGWEAHHRIRRRDMPGWCPCNIVALHARCHTQGPLAVHDHPDEARRLGLILHPLADPRAETLEYHWLFDGPVYLECDGMVVSPLANHPLASPAQEALPFDA